MTAARLNLLTDVAGLTVGHATDLTLGSGVTAVLFDPAAVASGLVLGGAPGGRDTALLAPGTLVERVDALVLSGGSAFGLDAAGGVQAALREQGRGFAIRDVRIPIVPQAILMGLLNGENKDWGRFSPYRDLGYAAAVAAGLGRFDLGTVGAGTGATTATVKGGLGSASAVASFGAVVGALVAVNAVGSATVGDGPHFWVAPFEQGAEFGGLGLPAQCDLTLRTKGGMVRPPMPGTTIGVVATDAALDKGQAQRLAIAAHDGLARAVLPAHLPSDGDTVFAAATGLLPAPSENDLTELCHLATLVMARAIARGVHAATALPVASAQPAWRDKYSGLCPEPRQRP